MRVPPAASARSASTSSAVISSPGQIAGMPGGYGATVSALILPIGPGRHDPLVRREVGLAGRQSRLGAKRHTAAEPAVRGRSPAVPLDRGAHLGDEPLDRRPIVGEGQDGHERVAVGHLELHARGEQLVVHREPVGAGAGQRDDQLERIRAVRARRA